MKNKVFFILLGLITLNLQGSESAEELMRERAKQIITLFEKAPKDAIPQAQRLSLDQRVLGEKFDEIFAKLQEAESTGATRGKMFDIVSAYTSREFTK
jgi:hypothetical protein